MKLITNEIKIHYYYYYYFMEGDKLLSLKQ